MRLKDRNSMVSPLTPGLVSVATDQTCASTAVRIRRSVSIVRCMLLVVAVVAIVSTLRLPAQAEGRVARITSEQRRIMARQPDQMPRYSLPDSAKPNTVAVKVQELQPMFLSIDDAIRMSLENVDVIRVLAGTSAVNSGRTIYDPAATTTTIDQQEGRFDPTLSANNSWNRTEIPGAFVDPLDPGRAIFLGTRTDNYTLQSTLSKLNAIGGTSSFGATTVPQRFGQASALNPLNRSSLLLSYTQPLLQGAGIGANLAGVDVAKLNTERSFYQFKDSMQENVRGVIEAYWSLVFARIDVWVRQRQVDQTQQALDIANAQFGAQRVNIGDVLQARTSLANFRANLVSSRANLIQREAALRNIIGMSPTDGFELVPTSVPRDDRFLYDWDMLRELAGQNRPDLIDLNLALQADIRLLAQANNTALPQVNATALYRWNGLSGTQPNDTNTSTGYGGFNDWTLGINASLPLGLRQARAAYRQQELVIARDRANLKQGLHAAVHILATNVRAVDQAYEQYLAFAEARKASRENLRRQVSLYRTGQAIYLNVLTAITDWGNSISSEANALTQYNTQLANLERQTGTILETRSIYFYEEQYGSIGPAGRFFSDRDYPLSLRPVSQTPGAAAGTEPAEESFELEDPPSANVDEPLPDLPYENELPEDRQQDNNLPPGTERKPLNLPELVPEPGAVEQPAETMPDSPSPSGAADNDPPDDATSSGNPPTVDAGFPGSSAPGQRRSTRRDGASYVRNGVRQPSVSRSRKIIPASGEAEYSQQSSEADAESSPVQRRTSVRSSSQSQSHGASSISESNSRGSEPLSAETGSRVWNLSSRNGKTQPGSSTDRAATVSGRSVLRKRTVSATPARKN